MLNFLDDERVERFYLRLNEPLRRMPAPERAELHQEVRQHLETLAAAHLELGASPEEAIEAALRSFGDPAIVGRKLMREWRLKNRDPFWATVTAIGVCQFAVSFLTLLYLTSPMGHAWRMERDITSQIVAQAFSLLISTLLPAMGGIAVGCRLPNRALSGAFFVSLIANTLEWFFIWVIRDHYRGVPMIGVSGIACLAAYVVSSIKRRDWTLQIR